MNKLKLFCCFFFLLFLLSCNNKKDNVGNSANIYTNDFESFFGYLSHVQKGKANSGQCYYAMDSTTEYSLTFMEKFQNISTKSYAKIQFSVSMLMANLEDNAALVIQIWDGSGTPIKVESKIISAKDIGVNKWSEATIDLNLKNLYAANHEVRCFVHNPSRQNLYLDDMTIEFFQ